MKTSKGYIKEETLLDIKSFCRACGKKLKVKSKWNQTKYDEYTGEALHFKYSACPDIEKVLFDNNQQPIVHTQTYRIKREKKV